VLAGRIIPGSNGTATAGVDYTATSGAGSFAPGELERQNEARNRIFGIPLVPSIVEQLAELGESLGLAFPNAADTTGLAETPA